jgi:hypothetical protein
MPLRDGVSSPCPLGGSVGHGRSQSGRHYSWRFGRASRGSDDRLISLPGRSPVLDAAQLGVLRGYGSERDVGAGDVLFADGDETYDLIVLLAGTADIIEGYGHPGAKCRRQLWSFGVSRRDRHAHRAARLP